jgi:putative ABC transport system permease protein
MAEHFLQDLRYAARQLRNNPGFALVTMLVLALGIGANAAVFAVINTVLLRPLSFPDPDQLVQVWESNPSHGRVQDVVSPYNFLDWQKQSKTLSALAVYEYESLALTTRAAPARMDAAFVSGGFFRVFQVQPQLGRTFLPEEDRPGSHAVVLSYLGWGSRFNYDPHIVGKSIVLDGEPYTVIGVMPAGFRFPARGTDLWAAPAFDLKTRSRGGHFLFSVGRMRPGVTLAQAQAEMNTIARRLEQQYPDSNRGAGVTLVSLQDQMVGHFKRGLFLLWCAVSLVLLIGCANVAHLLLARSVVRQKEFAIRLAMGASRSRLIHQLLTESSLLAVAGGLVGLALSPLAIKLLMAVGGRIVPRTEGIHIDAEVIAFTTVASLLTPIIFGLLPGFRSSRLDVAGTMKRRAWEASSGGSYRIRSVLVVSELALSVMLLISAGLLMKSFWQLRHVSPGFDATNVLGLRMSVPAAQYPAGSDRAVLYQEIIDRLRTLPGVEDVAATNDLPFSGSRTTSSFDIEGRPVSPGESREADYRTVSSSFFGVMRIPLLMGRAFREEDNRRQTPHVVIINDTVRRRYWPNTDPLGQHLILQDTAFEIIGVVGNVKHDDLTAAGSAEIYVPQYQGSTPPWTFLAIRGRSGLASMVPAIRNAVREVAPAEPIYDTRTMEDRLSNSIAPQRFNALMLAVFASFALLLAIIGIYGVVVFAAERRAHEMGIRMAVGAQPADVMRLVVGQGLRLGLIGVGIGVAATLMAARIISGMLYHTAAGDPVTYLVVSLTFLAVVSTASYLPARRAARLDPMVALRCE